LRKIGTALKNYKESIHIYKESPDGDKFKPALEETRMVYVFPNINYYCNTASIKMKM